MLLLSEVNKTTILQFFWWRCSTQLMERIDDPRIQQRCCHCSRQSTIGPHGLTLWPWTGNVILCQGSLVTHLEDKTIGWYCHNTGRHQLGFSICCAPHQLLLCRGLCKIWSGANLAPEILCTICAAGTFRVHRSLLPIGQSPIRVIVVRRSTSSLTRCLSHGAWVPAKSGGDCWHDLHIPPHDVQTQCFGIASALNNLGCHVAQPCQHCFSQWQQKNLWPTLLQWQS